MYDKFLGVRRPTFGPPPLLDWSEPKFERPSEGADACELLTALPGFEAMVRYDAAYMRALDEVRLRAEDFAGPQDT
jgi:hypothetical protein